MKKKLSDWASVAEILSGIAVVITLIVLIFGVRDNTAVLRASEYSALIRDLNNFQTAQMTDAQSIRLWRDYLDGEAFSSDMSAEDNDRLILAVLIYSRIYETAYYSNKYGLLGESEWARFARVSCQNDDRVQDYGEFDLLEETMTAEYVGYLAETCSREE